MMQVFFSDLAIRDLEEIWLFIADDSDSAADKVIDDIMQAIQGLTLMPLSGRARPELASDLRSIPQGSYVIFYRAMNQDIGIARVLHGSRDLPQHDYPAADAD